jgi:Tfp pilus assembly protein PilO
LTAVIAIAIIGAAWVLVVSPERKQAKELAGQVATAKTQLSVAESKLDTARQARARYASAYASVVSLGKAVPTTQEVPSLIYQLSQASKEKDVDFQSIALGTATPGTASSSSASSTSAAASTGFAAVPFTFVFSGSYFGLEHMLRGLTDVATVTPSGALQVSGRLLTIQSVKLSPADEGVGKSRDLTASIAASAYQLPPESTSAATTSTATSSASSASGASSSPTAPAIVRVK